jgi:hypothetical protein
MSGSSNLPPAAGPMPRMDLSRPPRGGRALVPPPSRPGYFTARYITPGMVQCNINTALQNPAIDNGFGKPPKSVHGFNL